VDCLNGIMAELVHEWLSLQSLDFLYLSWLRNSAILDFVSYSLFEDVVIVIRKSLVSQNQSAKEALNCIRTHEYVIGQFYDAIKALDSRRTSALKDCI
jgi:hypothetical protein